MMHPFHPFRAAPKDKGIPARHLDNMHDSFSMHTMKTRATITIEPELHRKAKQLARLRNTSVSSLFESYIRSEVLPGGSRVDLMLGSCSLKEAQEKDDPRFQALEAKYLKD